MIYVPGEETVLANFVENVGMRTVANGETIDLSDCMDFLIAVLRQSFQ